MYKKKSKLIGIAITIFILILLVFFSNVKSGSLSYIENAFSKVVMPLQSRIHLPKK